MVREKVTGSLMTANSYEDDRKLVVRRKQFDWSALSL